MGYGRFPKSHFPGKVSPRTALPLPSNRQHLSCGDCLEGKRGDYLTSSVLLCIIISASEVTTIWRYTNVYIIIIIIIIVHIICTPI